MAVAIRTCGQLVTARPTDPARYSVVRYGSRALGLPDPHEGQIGHAIEDAVASHKIQVKR